MSEKLRVHFDASMARVCEKITEMGTLVSEMVVDAVEALKSRDDGRALDVMRRDDAVDDQDLAIEEECLHLIWSQQPVAADLRVIGTALKIITDLERVGDHGVDIAVIARELAPNLPPPDVTDLPHLADSALIVLRDALRAFTNRDLQLVDRAIRGDDRVDDLYRRTRLDLDNAIVQDPSHALIYARLGLVALYLERIADHAVNIAERVAFMLTGDFKQLSHSHMSAAHSSEEAGSEMEETPPDSNA